jgi:RNA polymerase sigma-70 factor (sigma-E family)
MGTADDFEAWYRSERTALLRFAFLLCGGDRHTAEDAVADAVARCWPKIRRGRVDDSGAYVRRAVARRVIDGGRRRQVAAKHRDELEGEAGRAAASAGSGADPLDHLVLWPVVDALPTDQRVVVVLRFYLDWSEAQIAQALGIAPGTVKSRCARALDRLRTELAEVNDG